jgi:ATP-binding cassette, subfamily B, multidrug efflux pump
MLRFLWTIRPYFRQVAGELLLGSIAGILMNTAVVLPAILLGRAIDTVLAFSRHEVPVSAVTKAALFFVAGVMATEVPRLFKRWFLITANARMRAARRAGPADGADQPNRHRRSNGAHCG